jgi:hypothetical protein
MEVLRKIADHIQGWQTAQMPIINFNTAILMNYLITNWLFNDPLWLSITKVKVRKISALVNRHLRFKSLPQEGAKKSLHGLR